MLLNSLRELFLRDITKLKDEISLFADEEHLWEKKGWISNSAANLAFHLAGNLNHYIGHILGKSDYRRDREQEFRIINVPKGEIIKLIIITADAVEKALSGLEDADLQKIYPSDVFGKEITTEYFLIHLLAHLNYHLGQINYLRRITQ